MADDLERVSLTIPAELVDALDAAVEEWEYASRSKACRDALRMFLASLEWERDPASTYHGSITVVYDHHAHDVTDEMLSLQHEMADTIVATQHVHFDAHRCLETIVVEGTGTEIHTLVNRLRSLEGMEHVQFTNI